MGNPINALNLSFVLTLINLAISINNPLNIHTESIKLIENSVLTVFVESNDDLDFFDEAMYDENKKVLKFETEEETLQIRVYDKLESLVYQLPVRSDKIRIGKSLFDKGEYTLVFDVNGDRKMFVSRLEVY